LALYLQKFAVSQSEMGLREEALDAAQEGVPLYRELAQRNRDAFLPNLAMSCGALGSVRLGLNEHVEAAQALFEGLRLLLPYVEERPFAPHIRLALNLFREYLRATRQGSLEPDEQLFADTLRILVPYLNQSEGFSGEPQ
jgi:hypothetical protein